MFNLFRKKNKEDGSSGGYAGRKFGSFILPIPEDWTCSNDNGTLRASKNDTVRLSISMWDMSGVAGYSLDELFETVKAGYLNSDINWAVFSELTKTENVMYQTLEYLDDPRMIIAVLRQKTDGKDIVLRISFAGNSGKDVDANIGVFNELITKTVVIG